MHSYLPLVTPIGLTTSLNPLLIIRASRSKLAVKHVFTSCYKTSLQGIVVDPIAQSSSTQKNCDSIKNARNGRNPDNSIRLNGKFKRIKMIINKHTTHDVSYVAFFDCAVLLPFPHPSIPRPYLNNQYYQQTMCVERHFEEPDQWK